MTDPYRALKQNDLGALDSWLKTEGNLVDSTDDEHEQTMLFCAARTGRLQVATFLLDHGANPNWVDESTGGTALHAASWGGHLDCARLLVSRGADPRFRNGLGARPIDEARAAHHDLIVEYFLGEVRMAADPEEKALAAAEEAKRAPKPAPLPVIKHSLPVPPGLMPPKDLDTRSTSVDEISRGRLRSLVTTVPPLGPFQVPIVCDPPMRPPQPLPLNPLGILPMDKVRLMMLPTGRRPDGRFGYLEQYTKPLPVGVIRLVCMAGLNCRAGALTALPVPDGDLLVVAGGLTASGTDEDLAEAVRFLKGLPHYRKLVIPGAADRCLCGSQAESPVRAQLSACCTVLSDGCVTVAGMKFFGSPWVSAPMGGTFCRPDDQLGRLWAAVPEDVDVMITHAPPLNCFDLAWERSSQTDEVGCLACGEEHPQFQHWGSASLRGRIMAAPPKLHIFGHVQDGTPAVGRLAECPTVFVNASLGAHPRPVVIDCLVPRQALEGAQGG
ncbi:putative Ser/Thr phosphatase family protein [Paratrimastix pyriformis]|uniref:Ser/Thr phosphatase family protein n=1 Tax=Paratrimastix pyriformis TaxID=342808 RepID=A0ABQ8UHY0_9EUKA|nr:putative Ser/Thr phosphatase family protein [Paratrimastix pyriformis]